MNLISFLPYLWIALVVFSVVIEAVGTHMIALCFMPGAAAALVLALCSAPLWLQCCAFAVLSALILALRFTVFRGHFRGAAELEKNPEKLVGGSAVVIEPIDNKTGAGRIKIRGTVWSAASSDDRVTFAAGDMVVLSEYSVDRFICSAQ
ncbi:MAG: NfeD family protein [Eubacteriales bacterium]